MNFEKMIVRISPIASVVMLASIGGAIFLWGMRLFMFGASGPSIDRIQSIEVGVMAFLVALMPLGGAVLILWRMRRHREEP